MFDKMRKLLTPVNIILIVSLIINIVIIPRVVEYESYLDREISSSVDHMLFSVAESTPVIERIIHTNEMSELQYKSLYFDYEDFEHEFKSLVNLNNRFKNRDIDHEGKSVIDDFAYELFQIGQNNEMSLFKKKDDENLKVTLTDEEIKIFETINQYNNEILNEVYDEDSRMEFRLRDDKWIYIVKTINEIMKK